MRGFLHWVVILVAIISTSTSSIAQSTVQVPFLFTEDQATAQSDLTQTIRPSDALRKDSYLNGPMTRLEYMLSRMEDSLNGDLSIRGLKQLTQEGFGNAPPPHEREIRGYARYIEENGRVLVGWNIDGVGQPKKPMRDTYDAILELLRIKLPHQNVGYLLHNRLLGVLSQRDDKFYTPILATLASHFVHRVSIMSVTENEIYHTFACQREGKKGAVAYDKHSVKARR